MDIIKNGRVHYIVFGLIVRSLKGVYANQVSKSNCSAIAMLMMGNLHIYLA